MQEDNHSAAEESAAMDTERATGTDRTTGAERVAAVGLQEPESAQEPTKKVSDSRAEQVHIVMGMDINDAGRLFGGRLMEWIDVLGGVVCRRHCNRVATTVLIERIEFRAPAFLGDTVFMEGRLIGVGNTSMRVLVECFAEHLKTGVRTLINRCEMKFVALDEDQRPVRVPRLVEG